MNIIGIYARSYIDALTIAFVPLSQKTKSHSKPRDNRFASTKARTDTLPHAA